MSRLSNNKKKELAERMFINEGMMIKDIAKAVEITTRTLTSWKREGNWTSRRAELLSAPHKIKELLIAELQKISLGEKSNIDADALSKIGKVLENMSGKVSVQVVLSVFKEFDNWMAVQEAETAVSFLDWHKKFILYKASVDG